MIVACYETYAEVPVKCVAHGACHPSVKYGCNVVHEKDGINEPSAGSEGIGVGIDVVVGVELDVVYTATAGAGAASEVEAVTYNKSVIECYNYTL